MKHLDRKCFLASNFLLYSNLFHRPQFSIPEIPIVDTNYIPMARASDEIRDFVWNHILSFVFGIDLNNAGAGDNNMLVCSSNTHREISTVSKAFHVCDSFYCTSGF